MEKTQVKRTNIRRCISCGQLGSKAQFWRVVRSYPTGIIQINQGMGRSAYLCPTADCLKLAQKKRRLSKALRSTVTQEIYQSLLTRLPESTVRSP